MSDQQEAAGSAAADFTPSSTPVADLMSKDPLHHTERDVADIVAHLRSAREAWMKGNAVAGARPDRKPTKDETLTKGVKTSSSLEDLGLL